MNFTSVGIIGLGYVGLPLALRFAEVGVKVLGFDIDPDKVRQLNAGKSYIKHIGDAAVAQGVQRGMSATSDFTRASEPDALIICVPTPLNQYREPDLSFVINTTDALVPHLRKGQLVSLESTTYPGTNPVSVNGSRSNATNYILDGALNKALAASNVSTVELYWPTCSGR